MIAGSLCPLTAAIAARSVVPFGSRELRYVYAMLICRRQLQGALVDEDRQWFKSCVGLDVQETSRDVAFCAHAILDSNVMVVPDTFLDPRFADNPLVTDEPRLRFYAGYPLTLPDNTRVGTLCILDTRPRELDARKLALLRDLGSLVEREVSAARG